MAISNSIIKLQGTIAGLTFVNSRRYGDHVRAKRGTYKKASVNESFRTESHLLLKANIPAKIFKDAIEPYRCSHGGTLWPRLVSLFRKQLKERGSIDFSSMVGFEVDADHPILRIFPLRATITLNENKSSVSVSVMSDSHLRFTQAINEYRLTLIGIFPDLKNRTACAESITSDDIRPGEVIKPIKIEVRVPPSTSSFIVCVKIEAYRGGLLCETRATSGMRVIGGGVI
jgi:hypothetical protein